MSPCSKTTKHSDINHQQGTEQTTEIRVFIHLGPVHITLEKFVNAKITSHFGLGNLVIIVIIFERSGYEMFSVYTTTQRQRVQILPL